MLCVCNPNVKVALPEPVQIIVPVINHFSFRRINCLPALFQKSSRRKHILSGNHPFSKTFCLQICSSSVCRTDIGIKKCPDPKLSGIFQRLCHAFRRIVKLSHAALDRTAFIICHMPSIHDRRPLLFKWFRQLLYQIPVLRYRRLYHKNHNIRIQLPQDRISASCPVIFLPWRISDLDPFIHINFGNFPVYRVLIKYIQ